MANITESGWYNLSVPGTEELTFSDSTVIWGVGNAEIGSVYELSSEPLSDGTSLTSASWSRVKDDETLSPYKGYWVNLTLRKWEQKKEIIGSAGDQIGWSVSLSRDGTVLAIGKPGINQVDVYETTDGGETWTQKGDSIDPDDDNTSSVYGESVSLNSDGSIISIGDPTGNFAEVYEYNSNDSEWVQLGSTLQVKDDTDTVVSGTLKRLQLNSTGDTIVLGNQESGDSDGSGTVNVYSYDGSDWNIKGDILEGETANDYFGTGVAINSDGTIIAVGAHGGDSADGSSSNTGSVYVYEYASGTNTWNQKGTVQYGSTAGDKMGSHVKLNKDGTILMTGSSYGDNEETDTGYVRIWQYQSDDWVQLGQDIEGIEPDDNCSKMGINDNGDHIIVGFPGHSSTNETPEGFARTYAYNSVDDSWDQTGETLNGIEEEDTFGFSVSMDDSGDMIAIGAPFYSYDSSNSTYDKKGFVQIHKLESY